MVESHKLIEKQLKRNNEQIYKVYKSLFSRGLVMDIAAVTAVDDFLEWCESKPLGIKECLIASFQPDLKKI